jgi:hypothetical protein
MPYQCPCGYFPEREHEYEEWDRWYNGTIPGRVTWYLLQAYWVLYAGLVAPVFPWPISKLSKLLERSS